MAMTDLLLVALSSPTTPTRRQQRARCITAEPDEGEDALAPPAEASHALKRPRRSSWTTRMLLLPEGESEALVQQQQGLRETVRKARADERQGCLKAALRGYQSALLMVPDENELLLKIEGLEVQLNDSRTGTAAACMDVTNTTRRNSGDAQLRLQRCPSDLLVHKLACSAVKREHINRLNSEARDGVSAAVLALVNSSSREALTERLGAHRAHAVIEKRPFSNIEELSHLGLYHAKLIKLAKHSVLEKADLI